MLERRPYIKKFRTKNNHYIYDVATAEIIRVSQLEVAVVDLFHTCSLHEVIKKLRDRYDEAEIKKTYAKIAELAAHGFFSRSPLRSRLVPPAVFRRVLLQHFTDIQHLVLSVTEQCNMRCTYCVYSGNYELERVHSDQKMSHDIARKAIDYFASMVDPTKTHTISLYGGEPLLAFDLITHCVKQAKSAVRSQRLDFGVTTNGVLLKGPILEFLVKNEFIVGVSLDGPRELHDAHRVFASGSGSFDIVFRNMKELYKRYPEYYRRRLYISCVLTPDTDLMRFHELVKAYPELFARGRIRLAPMRSDHKSYGVSRARQGALLSRLSRQELLSLYKETLTGRRKSNLTLSGSLFDKEFHEIHQRSRMPLPPYAHLQPSCIPGQKKLFVAADGTFHMCERINPTLPIGHVDTGLDFDKICRIYSMYYRVVNQRRCMQCWAIRFCKHCYATLAGNGALRELPPTYCANFRAAMVAKLKEYCAILEENPQAFHFLDGAEVQETEEVKKALMRTFPRDVHGGE